MAIVIKRVPPSLNRIPAALGHLLPSTLAFFTPASGGSPNANEIDSLYKITLVIALVIFFAVEGALSYALSSSASARAPCAAQIHGNTRLEIGWTAAAAVILLGARDAHVRQARLDPEPAQLRPGRRDAGRTERPALREHRAQAAAERQIAEHHGDRPPVHLAVRLPGRQRTGRPRRALLLRGNGRPDRTPRSTLDIVSADVVHSWWVPELGGKFQAVPGYHNYTWFKIPKPGIFRGQCAFLCGRGHARMIATVERCRRPQFEAWLATRRS